MNTLHPYSTLLLTTLLASSALSQVSDIRPLLTEDPATPVVSDRSGMGRVGVSAAPDHAEFLPVQERKSWPREVADSPNRPDLDGATGNHSSTEQQRWGRIFHDEGVDGIWSMTRTFKTLANEDGFSFTPFLGSDAPRNYPVEFQLKSATLGEEALELTTKARVRREGDHITLDQGAVQTWYDISLDSVEQGFSMDVAGSSSDFVLELAIHSELQASEIPDGLAFTNELGGVIYRSAFVIDGAGRRLELPLQLVDAGVKLTVPGSFLEVAKAPVVIDPLLTTFLVQPGLTRDSHAPDVAYDVTNDVFAYVSHSVFSATDSDIWIETYNASSDAYVAGEWTDFTAWSWRKPSVANDNLSSSFLVVAQFVGQTGYTEIRGATHAAFGLARSPQFLIGDANSTWINSNPDVGGNSVNTSLFKVVWQRDFSSATRDQIRSVTVTPTNPHSTTVEPAVSSVEAVTSQLNADHSLPRISKSSGTSGNAEWQVVFLSTDGPRVFNARYADDNTLLSPAAPLLSIATIATLENLDVSAGLSALSGSLYDGPVYCLAIEYSDSSGHAIWPYVMERDFAYNGFALVRREHADLNGSWGLPAIASLSDRFVVSYMDADPNTGVVSCRASSLDYSSTNNFGINESRVRIGRVASAAFHPPGLASRFSGGNYSSRWVGIAHQQLNADWDVHGAKYAGSFGHTPGVQYCQGVANSTGERGFITVFGSSNTTSTKTLAASALPLNQFAYFLVGHGGTGQVAPPGSVGLLCITGSDIGRYNQGAEVLNTGSVGTVSLNINPTMIRSSGGSVTAYAGQTFNFQAWHRENGGSSNFTNAVGLRFE